MRSENVAGRGPPLHPAEADERQLAVIHPPPSLGGAADRFDYGTLEVVSAGQARSAAERIRKRTWDSYIANGRDLIAIKALLDHGAFGTWLKAEFGMSARTAQNLMNAAELVDGKSAIVSVLPVTAIYQLAAPSTPASVRDDVVARLENGEKLTVREIRSAIASGRSLDGEQKRLERLTPAARRRHQRNKERKRLQIERELEDRGQAEAEAEKAADAAVDLLTRGLGPDLHNFAELLIRAGCWRVQKKLAAARS
jgi:hypothetical protein